MVWKRENDFGTSEFYRVQTFWKCWKWLDLFGCFLKNRNNWKMTSGEGSYPSMRAGGKPSTWFPPGTRRAVHTVNIFHHEFPSSEAIYFRHYCTRHFSRFSLLKLWTTFIIFKRFSWTHNTGWKLRFDRVQRLVLMGNETSMWFKDFEGNITSNANAKYQLYQNIHVQHHWSGRGRAFSKTLRFNITLLARSSLLYELVPRAANRLTVHRSLQIPKQ